MLDLLKKYTTVALVLGSLSACASDGSVTRRDVGTAVGAGTGAVIGYEVGDHSALGAGLGAAGGAIVGGEVYH